MSPHRSIFHPIRRVILCALLCLAFPSLGEHRTKETPTPTPTPEATTQNSSHSNVAEQGSALPSPTTIEEPEKSTELTELEKIAETLGDEGGDPVKVAEALEAFLKKEDVPKEKLDELLKELATGETDKELAEALKKAMEGASAEEGEPTDWESITEKVNERLFAEGEGLPPEMVEKLVGNWREMRGALYQDSPTQVQPYNAPKSADTQFAEGWQERGFQNLDADRLPSQVSGLSDEAVRFRAAKEYLTEQAKALPPEKERSPAERRAASTISALTEEVNRGLEDLDVLQGALLAQSRHNGVAYDAEGNPPRSTVTARRGDDPAEVAERVAELQSDVDAIQAAVQSESLQEKLKTVGYGLSKESERTAKLKLSRSQTNLTNLVAGLDPEDVAPAADSLVRAGLPELAVWARARPTDEREITDRAETRETVSRALANLARREDVSRSVRDIALEMRETVLRERNQDIIENYSDLVRHAGDTPARLEEMTVGDMKKLIKEAKSSRAVVANEVLEAFEEKKEALADEWLEMSDRERARGIREGRLTAEDYEVLAEVFDERAREVSDKILGYVKKQGYDPKKGVTGTQLTNEETVDALESLKELRELKRAALWAEHPELPEGVFKSFFDDVAAREADRYQFRLWGTDNRGPEDDPYEGWTKEEISEFRSDNFGNRSRGTIKDAESRGMLLDDMKKSGALALAHFQEERRDTALIEDEKIRETQLDGIRSLEARSRRDTQFNIDVRLSIEDPTSSVKEETRTAVRAKQDALRTSLAAELKQQFPEVDGKKIDMAATVRFVPSENGAALVPALQPGILTEDIENALARRRARADDAFLREVAEATGTDPFLVQRQFDVALRTQPDGSMRRELVLSDRGLKQVSEQYVARNLVKVIQTTPEGATASISKKWGGFPQTEEEQMAWTQGYLNADPSTQQGQWRLGMAFGTTHSGGLERTNIEFAVAGFANIVRTGVTGFVLRSSATGAAVGTGFYGVERTARALDGEKWRGWNAELTEGAEYAGTGAVLGPVAAARPVQILLGAAAVNNARTEAQEGNYWTSGVNLVAGLFSLKSGFRKAPKAEPLVESVGTKRTPVEVPEVLARRGQGGPDAGLSSPGSNSPSTGASGGPGGMGTGGSPTGGSGSGGTVHSGGGGGGGGGGTAVLTAGPKTAAAKPAPAFEYPGPKPRGTDGATATGSRLQIAEPVEASLGGRLARLLPEFPLEMPLPKRTAPEVAPLEMPSPLRTVETAPRGPAPAKITPLTATPPAVRQPNSTILNPVPAEWIAPNDGATHAPAPSEIEPSEGADAGLPLVEEIPSEDSTIGEGKDEAATKLAEALESEGVELEPGEMEELLEGLEEVTRGLDPKTLPAAVKNWLAEQGLTNEEVAAFVRGLGLDRPSREHGPQMSAAPSPNSPSEGKGEGAETSFVEDVLNAIGWNTPAEEAEEQGPSVPPYWDTLTEEERKFGLSQLKEVNKARQDAGQPLVEGLELAIFAKRVREASVRAKDLMGDNPELTFKEAYTQAQADLTDAGVMFSGFNTRHSWPQLNEEGVPEGRGHSLHVVYSNVIEDAGGMESLATLPAAERQAKIAESLSRLYGDSPGEDPAMVRRFVSNASILTRAAGEVPLPLYRSTPGRPGQSLEELVNARANGAANSTAGDPGVVAGFYPDKLNGELFIFQYPTESTGVAIIGGGPGAATGRDMQAEVAREKGRIPSFVNNEFIVAADENGFEVDHTEPISGTTKVTVVEEGPDGPIEVEKEVPYSATLVVLRPRAPPAEPAAPAPVAGPPADSSTPAPTAGAPAVAEPVPASAEASAPAPPAVPAAPAPDLIGAIGLSPDKEKLLREVVQSVEAGRDSMLGAMGQIYHGLGDTFSEKVNAVMGAVAPSPAQPALSPLETKEKILEGIENQGYTDLHLGGAGGMGEVFFGKNAEGEEVALKIVKQGTDRTEASTKRLREQEYPFLRGLFEANADKEGEARHFLEVELAEVEVGGEKIPVMVLEKFGTTLDEIMDPNNPEGARLFGKGRYDQITDEQRGNRDWLARNLAEGVDEMNYPTDPNQPGRVHRDLKSMNVGINLDDKGNLKNLFLFDPLVWNPDEEVGADGKQRLGGTPYYMSRAQWTGDPSVDDRETTGKIFRELFFGEDMVGLKSNPVTRDSFSQVPFKRTRTMNANPNGPELSEGEKLYLAVVTSEALDQPTASGRPIPLTEKVELGVRVRDGDESDRTAGYEAMGRALSTAKPEVAARDLVANPFFTDPTAFARLKIPQAQQEQIFAEVEKLKAVRGPTKGERSPPKPVLRNVDAALNLAKFLQTGEGPVTTNTSAPANRSPASSADPSPEELAFWDTRLKEQGVPPGDFDGLKAQLGRAPTLKEYFEDSKKRASSPPPAWAPSAPTSSPLKKMGPILGGILDSVPSRPPAKPEGPRGRVEPKEVLDVGPAVTTSGQPISWQEARRLPGSQRTEAMQAYTDQWTKAAVAHVAGMEGATAAEKAAAYTQLSREIADRTRVYTGMGGALPAWKAENFKTMDGAEVFSSANHHVYISPEGVVYEGEIRTPTVFRTPSGETRRDQFYRRWTPDRKPDGTRRTDAEIEELWGLRRQGP